MIKSTLTRTWALAPLLLAMMGADANAQKAPYDVFPPAELPYYRVRYDAPVDALRKPGELLYGVNYTIWIPPGVKILRGVIATSTAVAKAPANRG